MADATLTITATRSGGAVNRAAELQKLDELVEMALQAARGAGGGATSGTVTAAFGGDTATWDYSPVASS